MSTLVTHTPTPWKLFRETKKQGRWGIESFDQTRTIALLPNRQNAWEDASLIVTAINAHDELVAALKTIAQRAVDYPKSEMAHLNAETAHAALAKVEGI